MSNIHKNFNSRTRVGATVPWTIAKVIYQQFQFTHPCGCDPAARSCPRQCRGFNSRTRVGATPTRLRRNTGAMVSIHAPVWVRPTEVTSYDYNSVFQFTHPCGCDHPMSKIEFSKQVFQFTHPCGCDRIPGVPSYTRTCFNSRTRVGATFLCRHLRCGQRVSIHAPVWVRRIRARRRRPGCRFQFTHPCGCDHHGDRFTPVRVRFNSRTRVGATSLPSLPRGTGSVSIHAPVWVRLYSIPYSTARKPFQFTHPCGCDQAHGAHVCFYPGFNSRTRVGATPDQSHAKQVFIVSIHAPVWVRLSRRRKRRGTAWFQFTHPCGCDGLTNTV